MKTCWSDCANSQQAFQPAAAQPSVTNHPEIAQSHTIHDEYRHLQISPPLHTSPTTDWASASLTIEVIGNLQDINHSARPSLVQSDVLSEPVCMDLGAGDPHFKVAQAALSAVQACLQYHSSLFEVNLDRLLPVLAQRITDTKEATRLAATGYAPRTPPHTC